MLQQPREHDLYQGALPLGSTRRVRRHPIAVLFTQERRVSFSKDLLAKAGAEKPAYPLPLKRRGLRRVPFCHPPTTARDGVRRAGIY